VSSALSQLREEHRSLQQQAAWLHNECLVSRTAESLLSEKLFAQSVTVDNIRRALGQHTTCPRKFPKAVPVTERWPHEPLSKAVQSARQYSNLRFKLGDESYVATATDVTSD
jgi:hypothetical protein